jgi:hypothetical protein
MIAGCALLILVSPPRRGMKGWEDQDVLLAVIEDVTMQVWMDEE